MSTTAKTLIAEFGTREIPLELVCVRYFGMTIKAARNAVALGAFPLPTYRAGGVKSPLLVRADDLARLRDPNDKELDLDRAKLLIEAGQTVINSAKVEVDFMRVTGQMSGTGFIPVAEQPMALPGGDA